MATARAKSLVIHDIASIDLAAEGRRRTEWAAAEMPVLRLITERFRKEKPLRGQRIAGCLHVTTETANLMLCLQAGGAEIRLCASNPLSTQDDVAAHLVQDHGISVFAVHGIDTKGYYKHINACLDFKPTITMDDGCDLVNTLHTKRREVMPSVIGGTEETTTGVIRLRAMEKDNALGFPVVAVNDADTKHLFDNRYGTGQSTVDGIVRATNLLLAGRKVIVAGYGWCGRGFALRVRGMGAHVVVTEVDPIKALEATMDGFTVLPMLKAAADGDLFVTLTGDINVIDEHHFLKMKDGAVVCNSGHFDVEINLTALRKLAKARREVRHGVIEYTLPNGRGIRILSEGRLVNLSAAEGHPASVMDLSFADQALAGEFIAQQAGKLERKVYTLPQELDVQVAKLKLKSMGVGIDKLTKEQQAYLASYQHGT